MTDLTNLIIGMTSEGAGTSKAAVKSLENTIRTAIIKKNVSTVNDMTQNEISEFKKTKVI